MGFHVGVARRVTRADLDELRDAAIDGLCGGLNAQLKLILTASERIDDPDSIPGFLADIKANLEVADARWKAALKAGARDAVCEANAGRTDEPYIVEAMDGAGADQFVTAHEAAHWHCNRMLLVFAAAEYYQGEDTSEVPDDDLWVRIYRAVKSMGPLRDRNDLIRAVYAEWKAAVQELESVPSGRQESSTKSAVALRVGQIDALLGDGVRDLQIASDASLNVEQKLQQLFRLNNEYIGWSAPRLAELVGCSDGRIRQTEIWKATRPKAGQN